MASSVTRVALVTGANSGVGLALSSQLAAAGYKVYAAMRDTAKAEALMEAATAAGAAERVLPTQMNVGDDESVAATFASITETDGRIDVLVNNAGYTCFGTVEQLSMAAMQEQFNVNVFGPIRCIKGALPMMRAQSSGKIINVSSIGGIYGQPFNDIYCSSKFALEGLSESQCALFRKLGIYTTVVEPGGIRTNFVNNAIRPDVTTTPAEYLPYLQATAAAYTAPHREEGAQPTSQTADEVAAVIMEQVVAVDEPPLRVQSSERIRNVAAVMIADITGEASVKMSSERFLTLPADAGAPPADA